MCAVGSLNHCDRVRNGIRSVMTDEGFKIGSSKAKVAVESANCLIQWAAKPENEECFCKFSELLVKKLEKCLTCAVTTSSLTNQKRRERMWKSFHEVSSSEDFRKHWETFLSGSTSTAPCPIFYQYVTDSIFNIMLKEVFPISAPRTVESLESLTYIEKNALRYAAGYIPRSLFKKIKKSSHQNKDELLLCLDDMVQGDTGTETDVSQDWITALNRGGLINVTSEMYMVICAMEIELRPHLQKDLSHISHFRHSIVESIMVNEDVLFFWSILSAPWEVETEIEQELLRMVADLWMTVRGFSFVSAWIEKFKALNKKTTQKSKGLRKTLGSS